MARKKNIVVEVANEENTDHMEKHVLPWLIRGAGRVHDYMHGWKEDKTRYLHDIRDAMNSNEREGQEHNTALPLEFDKIFQQRSEWDDPIITAVVLPDCLFLKKRAGY